MKSKKIFPLLLAGLMLFSSVTVLATENNNAGAAEVEKRIEEIEASVPSDAEIVKQGISNAEYQDLINAIYVDGQYPSYYAGAYINENDDLVVILTDEASAATSAVKEATGNENIIIQYAPNSLNFLKALQNDFANTYEQLYVQKAELNTFSLNETDVLEDLAGFYVDEINNELVVEIRDITDEKIQAFKDLFGDEDTVRFDNGYNFELTASEWRPGRKIYTSSSSSLSTGYRCYYLNSNGTRYNGFATAGHAYSSGNSVYRSSGAKNKLGECKVSQFSGNSDAAFIAITDSNYEASNTMYYSNSSGSTSGGATISASDYTTNAPAGTTLYKVGATSYLTSGEVETNGYTVTYSGVSISDTLRTKALNLSGDSGGCAYIVVNGTYVAAGTMSGSSYTGDALTSSTFVYSYVSQIKNARTDLGIRKY